ncbi:hypothetical protein LCGC14_0360280 [marine sediment metagenome]|uniref:Uncharacterized protein n=1 Tax=marine sediment metagenome TaxID=412755 RepID=A0A0F9TE49_9ZZZZ
MKRKRKNTTGSLTIRQAKGLLNNPPKDLPADVKDLLNTMRKCGVK